LQYLWHSIQYMNVPALRSKGHGLKAVQDQKILFDGYEQAFSEHFDKHGSQKCARKSQGFLAEQFLRYSGCLCAILGLICCLCAQVCFHWFISKAYIVLVARLESSKTWSYKTVKPIYFNSKSFQWNAVEQHQWKFESIMSSQWKEAGRRLVCMFGWKNIDACFMITTMCVWVFDLLREYTTAIIIILC
jgi:hypothetical protein